jgi:predicted nucleotidyltransferase
MVKTREDVFRLVREFREHLAAVYGERPKGVYLYGSYARGQATEDSDIDVAVVLVGPVDRRAEDDRNSDLIGDLSLRENCVLMPVFISEDDFRKTPYAIHRSIVREGVPA